MDTRVQSCRVAFLLQTFDIQVFDTDRCIGINILAGEFVQEIFFLIRDMIIDLLKPAFCLLPVLREPFFPGNALLNFLDLILRMFIEARVLDRRAVAIDCLRVQTNIDPDRSSFTL